MIRSGFAAIAAGFLATTALVSTAEAQRFVTFGDSLSDRGNLFALSGQPPVPYFNGRFSNGPVWIEYLAATQAGWTGGATPTGSLNFAFGGSRTDTIMTPGPGTATQVGAFFAGGGTFGASDIVTMWAGANNIFQGIAVPANQNTTAMGAIATQAATDVVTQVGQLAAGGARTIVVLSLPDLGGAPNFNTGPAAPLATFTVNTFNGTLATGLNTVAAANPNTRILQVNIAALFNAVTANPTAFGFTNVTQQCLTTVACVTGTTAVQNQNLFWDGVHPTAAGHRYVAQAVTQYLNAADRSALGSMIAEIGVSDRRSATYSALNRLSDYKPDAGKSDIYISVIGEHNSFGGRAQAPGYSGASGGIEFGVIRHITNQTSLGFALSTKTGSYSGSGAGNKLETNPTAFMLDIVGRWVAGNGMFVQGALGAGLTRFGEYERKMNIGTLKNTADPLTASYSAVLQTGYDMAMGTMVITPSVRVGYLSGNTRSFREAGAIAPLAYSGRTVSTFLAAAEIKTKFALSQTMSAHTVVGYEAYFGQTGSTIRGSIADSPGSNFSQNVGKVKSPGFLFGLGMAGTFGNVQATADYRGSLAEGGKVQHRGTISTRIGF